MKYSYNKKIDLEFEEVLERTREGLKKEGFGILTEINVKNTLKNKLAVDYKDYVILGACNPPFAYESLKLEEEVGLLLPCNVIVYRKEGEVVVSVIDPVVAMSIVDNPSLKVIAEEIREKLKRVVDNI